MQIFVTDFGFSPLRTRRVASTFMRKCAKPQKNPGPKLQKKEHQKKWVPFVFQCWLRSWDLGYIEKLINDLRCSAKKCPGFYEYVP